MELTVRIRYYVLMAPLWLCRGPISAAQSAAR
jgi:hypothetical protein